MTFAIMFYSNNMREPLAVAIDEDHKTLLNDVQRAFSGYSGSLMNSDTRIKEIRIDWGQGDFESGSSLDSGNIIAMLGLIT